MFRDLHRMLLGLGLAWALTLPAAAQAPKPVVLTPVQAAYLKTETKKANEAFIKQVAKTAGASEPQVRRALPDEKRITDRMARLVSALEQDLKRSLSEEEKATISAAEEARKKSINDAQTEALRK